MKLLRGFALFGLAVPMWAQYAGPAILSRGEAPAAMSSPTIDFAFSIALTGNYTNGLLGVQTTSAQGTIPTVASYGAGVTLGLSGAHSWRHTRFGVNYSGGFTDYFSSSHINGISQGVSMSLSHQFSKHINFSLSEAAGWFTQFPPATVALNSAVSFDPSQSTIPTTDFYNNNTLYSTTAASLTAMATSRLSFAFSGTYITNLRTSPDLYSAHGEGAGGDVQYRLSRRATIGGGFNFEHYSYSHSIGGAFVYSGRVSLSMRLDRLTEFSLYGGASYINSSFQQTVPLAPSVLAILCPPGVVLVCPLTGTTVINNNTYWGPDFGVRFSRSFERGVFSIGASEGITPGNGLFLTSRAITGSATYGYSGLRKWSMSVGVYYVTAESFGNVQGGYGQVTGYFGMGRQLFGRLSFVSSFNATQYFSNSFSNYDRLIYSASIGLGFSSKNIPVRFF